MEGRRSRRSSQPSAAWLQLELPQALPADPVPTHGCQGGPSALPAQQLLPRGCRCFPALLLSQGPVSADAVFLSLVYFCHRLAEWASSRVCCSRRRGAGSCQAEPLGGQGLPWTCLGQRSLSTAFSAPETNRAASALPFCAAARRVELHFWSDFGERKSY